MSRNVCVISCKGYKYIRVCESYRNAQGQPRSRVVENHGRLAVALAQDPDYLVKLKARVAQENAAAKAARAQQCEADAQTRIRRWEKMACGQPDYRPVRPLCLGAALLRQIWKDFSLPQLFRYLQSKTKIEYNYEKAAFLLMSERLLHPGSKRQTFANRAASIVPFAEIADLNTLYRVLDRLQADKKNIVRHLNREINKKLQRTVTAAFYDVTTYAFESRSADALKNFGLSKDHKVNEVQVVLGLVIDDHGIPLDYELFPGNTSEFGTMLPLIERLKKDYHLQKLVVVADRGWNSDENLQALQRLGCDFVLAQKVKNCTAAERRQILATDNWEQTLTDADGIVLQYKTLMKDKPLYTTKISAVTRRKYRVGRPIGQLATRWIVSYSRQRARKDLADIERAVDQAKTALLSKSNLTAARGYKNYIKLPPPTGTPALDLPKIQEAKQWAGFYALCTNLKTESAHEVMNIYRGLWRIEDCFRVSKTILETRPCFVWTENHIRGHFLSCYLSLVLQKYLEHVMKRQDPQLTTEKMIQALRSALVIYDDAPQCPVYQRAYDTATGFDAMLQTFGLTPPRRWEDKNSLQRKLHLREISTGSATPE